MFSIKDIKRNYDLALNNKTKEIEYFERSENQRDLEKHLIANFSQCPIPKQDITKKLASLDPLRVKIETLNNFYNFQVTTAIACISENLITISPDWQNYIRSYFSDLKQIGTPSNFGTAFLTDLKNPYTQNVGKNLFVIKAAKDKESENDILHEAMVGMLVLNNLRKIIPNFACIYGFFKCGGPTVNDAGNVLNWCTGNNKVGYVIYENIENSHSMNELFDKKLITIEQYLQYIVQFLFALKIANVYCKFTHYDCHGSNVLLRKLPQPVLIKYPITDSTGTGTDTTYIKTDAVVTFIDYGMSYVEGNFSDGSTYKLGTDYDFEKYNIFNDKDFILHDIFKFICSGLYAPEAKIIRKDILKYFYTDKKPLESFTENAQNYYQVPAYTSTTKNFNIDNFINFILGLIEKNGWTSPIVIPQPDDKILSCDGDVCASLEDIMKTIGL